MTTHLACNQYPWITFFQRQGLDYSEDLERVLSECVEAGIQGYEPIANSPDDFDSLAPLLDRHGLEMRSLYVNSIVHDPDQSAESIAGIIAIAEKAKEVCGTHIIVTNPSPLKWGDGNAKNDEQLRHQAQSLGNLGAHLADRGITLSYHIHAPEMSHSAREFHHMLLSNSPEHLTLCLDAHWIYRGAGNSNVALFDIIHLYGDRVSELHVRNSRNEIWTEELGDGDINWADIVKALEDKGVTDPHIVLEQAVEKDSPNTMNGLEAHKLSVQYARQVF
ncbi:MAG: sugar phosphate isomerase/epimerase [Planctomycetota bacterium]|nr:sugar phosphate isomerase/epimerase [Planctomycetota bacterium]